jgi:hypothetical protein
MEQQHRVEAAAWALRRLASGDLLPNSAIFLGAPGKLSPFWKRRTLRNCVERGWLIKHNTVGPAVRYEKTPGCDLQALAADLPLMSRISFVDSDPPVQVLDSTDDNDEEDEPDQVVMVLRGMAQKLIELCEKQDRLIADVRTLAARFDHLEERSRLRQSLRSLRVDVKEADNQLRLPVEGTSP